MNLFSHSPTASDLPSMAELIQSLKDRHSQRTAEESKKSQAKIRSKNGTMKLKLLSSPQRLYRLTHDRESSKIPEEVKATIRNVIAGELPWPLYMWGPPQFGKTSAALLLCDLVSGSYFWDFQLISHVFAQVKRGEPVIFSYRGRVTEEGWREPERVVRWNMNSFLKHLRTSPLIVVDEIGLRDNPTPSQYECLITILDERRGLPLILTSNIPPEELEVSYDGRIRQRIDSKFSGGTSIHFSRRFLK